MAVALTVNVVALRASKVLMIKREDFHVWCLPGGNVDPGESVADAAVREAREETGYDVTLQGLVGIYSAIGDWPDMHACVFGADVVDGEPGPLLTPGEVLDVGWFSTDDLPADIIWWHAQLVADALAGCRGLVVEQRITSRLRRLERPALYAVRDASGMTPLAFFQHNFPPPPAITASHAAPPPSPTVPGPPRT